MNLKFKCEIWCLKPGLAQIRVIFSFCGWESLPHSSRSASKIMGWNGVGRFLHKDHPLRLECTCKINLLIPHSLRVGVAIRTMPDEGPRPLVLPETLRTTLADMTRKLFCLGYDRSILRSAFEFDV